MLIPSLVLIALVGLVSPPVPPSDGTVDPIVGATRTDIEGELAPVQHWFARPMTVASALGELAPSPRAGTTSFHSVNQDPEGDMPRELAYLPDGSAVVIANRDTDTVTFLDVTTRTITHTVAVGDFPVHVAVTPDGQYALVPCVLSNSLFAIDIATHAVAAIIPVNGQEPYRVEVTADGAHAVVGLINDAVNSAFSIIDLNTLTELRTIPTTPQGSLGGFFTPESGTFGNIFTQFAVSADNLSVVLPDRFGSRVSLYDLTTGATRAVLPTATLPTAVDVSDDGTTAVVSHESNTRTITVIDVTTATVSNAWTTASDLFSQIIRISPDRSHALASIINNLIFVNLTTGATTATLFTGSVGDIEFSHDGQYAFVANFNARVISLATQTIVRTIPFAACAEAATSPVDMRAVALNNRFREDAQVYNINGVAGFFEGRALSGEPFEGDAPRTVALAPDGHTALIANNTSRTATFVDLDTGVAEDWIDTGERSLNVAISPDGNTALVINTDSHTVSILDMNTRMEVANLAVGNRPAEVIISPDSQWAYVTSVAGADSLHFIQLAGAASTLVSSLPTGQMGSIGYTYTVVSGIALSPDGAILAVCISFDDEVMLVDTAARTELARLPTGDFPIRAAFSPAGNTLYVINSFSDDASVYSVNLASQSFVTSVGPIEFPFPLQFDDTGSFAYVGSWDFSNPSLKVIDASAHSIVASVPLASLARSAHHSPLTSTLYVNLTGGTLVRVAASGATSSVIDSTPLSGSPSDLAFSESRRVAMALQPGTEDGFDRVEFADECTGTITTYGTGCAGTGGFVPSLDMTGCPVTGGHVTLEIQNGLGPTFAFLFIGTAQTNIPMGGGCFLLTAPVVAIVNGLPIFGAGPGNGQLSLEGTLPPGASGAAVGMQAFLADPGTAKGFSNTNGVWLTVP